MNPRITQVFYCSPYKLHLTFTNGQIKEFNLAPYLRYPVYGHLVDEGLCARCKVFNGTVIWDNETDFEPDTLYLESKELVIQ